jgi:hypothetical protein
LIITALFPAKCSIILAALDPAPDAKMASFTMFLLLFGHFFLDPAQILLKKAELAKWYTYQ